MGAVPIVDQPQDGNSALQAIGLLGVVILASAQGAAASADAAVVDLDVVGMDLRLRGDGREGMFLLSAGNPPSALGTFHLGCQFNAVGQALAVADVRVES